MGKNHPKQLTRHHRRPRSKKGKNNQNNLSYVSRVQHQAWHTLFGDMDVEEIVDAINRLWIDPTWVIKCEPKGGKNVRENIAHHKPPNRRKT